MGIYDLKDDGTLFKNSPVKSAPKDLRMDVGVKVVSASLNEERGFGCSYHLAVILRYDCQENFTRIMEIPLSDEQYKILRKQKGNLEVSFENTDAGFNPKY